MRPYALILIAVFVTPACVVTLEPGDSASTDASLDSFLGDTPSKDGSLRDTSLDVNVEQGTDATLPDGNVEPPAVPLPTFYPAGRKQSPINQFVANNLVSIASNQARNDNAFSKVGDSVTVSTRFMHCFSGNSIDLGGRPLQASVDQFDSTGSFDRTSLAATIGWHAGRPLEGSPSALSRELSSFNARFAAVMYGTNDVGFINIYRYADTMLTIVDTMIAQGVIPVLSSFPPRGDNAEANARVPGFNLVVRALAQARQIPFVDFYSELVTKPSSGLGGDNIHPNAFGQGACILTNEGLQFGYNVRNLMTLQGLHRAARALDGSSIPNDGIPIRGSGTATDPFIISELPFTHSANTATLNTRTIDQYGCSSANEGGPEVFYKLELQAATTVTARVFDQGTVDIDIHLLTGSPTAAACSMRDNQLVEGNLPAGTHYFALDTFVGSNGAERGGEYFFTVQ